MVTMYTTPMQPDWERALDRWQQAGLLDAAAVERIQAFEQQDAGPPGLRWPVIVALVFGGLMLGAGVLLFVAAHWDTLSPSERFTLVAMMVAVFHIAGAVTAQYSENFAITLHGIGTAALGAGIFLTGQIFNLQEHWPGGVMLWAAGAWIGWLLRRDWLQFAFAAILTPFWLAGEWIEAFPSPGFEQIRVLMDGLTLLSITYFCARTRNQDGMLRNALAWIGGVFLLPCAIVLATEFDLWRGNRGGSAGGREVMGYALAFGLPLALAWWLRKRDFWMNAIAAAWVFLLGVIAYSRNIGLFAWCALGAVGMIAWGVREGRSERVNMGMAGFALTLLFFYFSEVMDKLGRSASLIGLGLLFLAGGWALERLRRKLVAHAREIA
jgi:uncharacterized membrane protein